MINTRRVLAVAVVVGSCLAILTFWPAPAPVSLKAETLAKMPVDKALPSNASGRSHPANVVLNGSSGQTLSHEQTNPFGPKPLQQLEAPKQDVVKWNEWVKNPPLGMDPRKWSEVVDEVLSAEGHPEAEIKRLHAYFEFEEKIEALAKRLRENIRDRKTMDLANELDADVDQRLKNSEYSLAEAFTLKFELLSIIEASPEDRDRKLIDWMNARR